MWDIPFGCRVEVAFRVDAWYLDIGDAMTTFNRNQPRHKKQTIHNWKRKGEYRNQGQKAPGLAMPGTKTPRRMGTYRVLRRFDCNRTGIVIGKCRRMEGKIYHGWDEAGFAASRGYNLVQVALEIQPRHGSYPWPASIVEALFEDIHAITDRV